MRARRNEGWVLIETLVAMVLLSVGVLAINRALLEARKTRAIAQDYTTARFLMEEKMGELELQPEMTEGDSGSGSFGDVNPRFSYSWSVAKVDIPTPAIPADLQPFFLEPPRLPDAYLGKISVTIAWTRADREFSATAETLIPGGRIRTLEEADAIAPPPA
ncbi:MAG: hypothetical protein HUU46_23110 [Candidatus Hydrogenedentes bacterium]|nr:hypothetical protein [Candidatus Hydrogenedentota bacterium]